MKRNHHKSRENPKSSSIQSPYRDYHSRKRRKNNVLSRATPLSEQTELSTSSSEITVTEQPARMEIPGYYYDADKKRYFKIMPNRCIDNEHPFSEQSVREKLNKSRIDPSSSSGISSQPSSLQYLKEREICGWSIYSRCIRQSRNIMCKALCHTGVIEPYMLTSAPAAITKMQVHPTRNEIFNQIDFRTSQKIRHHQITDRGSEITSIRLISNDHIVFTTIGSAHIPGALLIYRQLADMGNLPNDTYITHELVFQFKTSKSTFWNCDTVEKRMVIGANREAIYFLDTTDFTQFSTESDIFAAHIDRAQPSTFYAGGRDGLVRLFDVRSSSKSPHGIGPTIRYQGSSITNIEKVGPYGLLACVMDGRMDIWDLRAPRGEAAVEQRNNMESMKKRSHKKGKVVGGNKLCPIVEFRGHNNEYNRNLGFSMNCDQTIIAVAGADSILRFFSVTDGGQPFHTIKFPSQITSLQFDEWEASENYLQQFPLKTIIKDRELAQRWEKTYMLRRAYKGEGLWVAVEGLVNWMSVGGSVQ